MTSFLLECEYGKEERKEEGGKREEGLGVGERKELHRSFAVWIWLWISKILNLESTHDRMTRSDHLIGITKPI